MHRAQRCVLEHPLHAAGDRIIKDARRTGTILVIDDDPEVRELLEVFLKDEGHRAATAIDGIAALDLVERGTIRPDLVLSDYNLPNGLDGLQLATQLRKKLHRPIPVIILTGDISTGTLRDIELQGCLQLNKPVKLQELTQSIQRLLSIPQATARVHSPKHTEVAGSPVPPTIFVVDDDRSIRDAIRSVLEEDGRIVEDYAACEEFLEAYRPGREACLVIDAYLPGMDGFELLSGSAVRAIGCRPS